MIISLDYKRCPPISEPAKLVIFSDYTNILVRGKDLQPSPKTLYTSSVHSP